MKETPAQNAILEARGVEKHFGATTVLHGVDLTVRRGEFLSIMGPSGCGKSTLLYAVSGMDRPDAGTVSLDGEALADLNAAELANLRLTRMGFVFQQVHLLKNLTLLDNVVLPGYLAKLAPRAVLNERAGTLMARTGVGELGDRDISQASGGQLQRVAICRALINDPTIVFGDEPTGALDSTAAQEIMGILEELNADGMTMLLVTHDPRVASHGDRVIYMIDGRIAAELELDREEHLGERQAAVDTWLATLR